MHPKIIEKYKLKDVYHEFLRKKTPIMEKFVYIIVRRLRSLLKDMLFLEQGEYKADYTENTFTIDFFRDNPYYYLSLINMIISYTFAFDGKVDKKLLIDYINGEFKQMEEFFGLPSQNNTLLLDDGTLFAEDYSQDPFLIGLKEDLLKIINFNTLSNNKSISVIINREQEPEIDIKEQLLQQLKQLNPTQFEKFSLYIIKKIAENIKGASEEDIRIKHNGQVGDGGIDGIMELKNMFHGYDTYLIQCKRYDKTSIGRPELQTFVGAMVGHNATHGIFITTSSFTKGALEFVQNVKFFSIKTMDGKTLVEYMLKHKIGITEKTQTIQTIDIPFFQQFSL